MMQVDFWTEEDEIAIKMENRMYQCKQDCLVALADIVHPKYINKFAEILAFAFEQGDHEAQSIADELKLDELNFLAVLDRESDFRKTLYTQLENEYLLSLESEV